MSDQTQTEGEQNSNSTGDVESLGDIRRAVEEFKTAIQEAGGEDVFMGNMLDTIRDVEKNPDKDGYIIDHAIAKGFLMGELVYAAPRLMRSAGVPVEKIDSYLTQAEEISPMYGDVISLTREKVLRGR